MPHAVTRPGPRAVTTIELLVSIGVMIVAMAALVGVFNVSSEIAGRTAAHAEVLESSATIQGALTEEMSRIVPGLLIIESPPPTDARAETPDGPRLFRLRHDRLVFIARGPFQSCTDPTRGTPADPAREPATGDEAIVYFGPGLVLENQRPARSLDDPTFTASEWLLLHRRLLLLARRPSAATTDPAWLSILPDMRAVYGANGLLNGGDMDIGNPALEKLLSGACDAIQSESTVDQPWKRASAGAVADLLAAMSPADILTNGDNSLIRSLWQPSWAPRTLNLNPLRDDYYVRGGSNFVPRLADLRIEWTDGRRVDPWGPDANPGTPDDNNFHTRWFGLAPEPGQAVDLSDPPATVNALRFQARMRAIADPFNPSNPNTVNPDNPPLETAVFASQIEWSPNGVNPAADARYRAIWTASTWQYRPRALRLTYRVYDPSLRLKEDTTIDLDGDGQADPNGSATPYVVPRFGVEFSIVVPVP